MSYDKIIIGAGLYGLYAAYESGKKGQHVLVLEYDDAPFSRATYVNQARVHMGYHYPRSYATAVKSAHYFERFNRDYGFCIHGEFEKVYAISSKFSWTSAPQFKQFCANAGILCKETAASEYFRDDMCSGAFVTKEYTYDAMILRDWFLDKISKQRNVEIQYGIRIGRIYKADTHYAVVTQNNTHETDFLLNATYASANQIIAMLGYEPFKIKYELCEIILCEPGDKLKNVGLTVMDGPFFSIMPFGRTPYHSLTSVTFTPHITSYDTLPSFSCQARSAGLCSPDQLYNCNICPAKPKTAYPYMGGLAHKYLKDAFSFTYKKSLFSMKPILQASEIDDSRPTVIRVFSESPTFISVLSGKINTVYDLDEYL